MASTKSEIPFALTAAKPTSVQPGGGWCLNLELAWGRLRRAYLRRFRAGYVRQMLEKRRGACTDCCHDIIDARDLKFCRNVCGYSFDGQDVLQGPNRLRLARAGLAEVVCFSLMLGVLFVLLALASLYLHPIFLAPLVLVGVIWLFVVSFFRDPERRISTHASDLVSPADGTVTHIDEVDEPDFPSGRAVRISIFLSVFNVHVNRVPRRSRVRDIRYFAGAFLDARHHECSVRNEQLWIDFEDAETQRPIRVKQISGAIARRIVCWLRPGEEVLAGQRFGMIKFGSRTEVLLTVGEEMELKVRVGDKVKGGSSILLKFVT
jgi:phosphatidylserine decarboxylase